MDVCAKCHVKAVYYEEVIGENCNKCINCGWMHTPNTSMQSFERQVTGKNVRFGIGDMKAQMEAFNASNKRDI